MSTINPADHRLDETLSSLELFEEAELLLSVRRESGQSILGLYGELDPASVPLFRREVNRAIDEGSEIVLDLSALHFIDSTGIQGLIAAVRRAGARSVVLSVLRPPPDVDRILAITCVAELLPYLD